MARYENSLGGFIEDATSAVSGAIQSDMAQAAAAVATDPYLPTVVNLVVELREIEAGKPSLPGGQSPSKGIGLRNVAGPLGVYVWTQRRPWVVPLTVVGVFGLLFAAGYYTRKLSS